MKPKSIQRGTMTAKRPQKQLDEIWKNIKDGNYKKAAKELPGLVIIAPEQLFSDEGGDGMSIPSDGTRRDCYRRKPGSTKWEIF
jgi:hypothetical protein